MDILIYLLGAIGICVSVAFVIWVIDFHRTTKSVLEPVPVTPPKEKGTWVRFAGKWMMCRMEGGQGGRGMPTLAVVRLTDKRTHSRRIVRLLDDVREMNA